MLGAPVAVGVIIFKHFNRKEKMMELEARLASKINKLKEPIERMEEVQ